MKNTAKVLSVLLGVVFVLALTGCRKCVEPTEPVPPPPPPEAVSEEPLNLEQPAEAGEFGLQTVYFDFDKSDIRPGDAGKMQANAGAINGAAGSPVVTVEGHCDPVGTSEYNMALGMRRAEAAKAYLARLGVDAARLSTISYGEERLVTQNEAEFEMNRRAEFKVVR
ncbi:MAG: OmpA family protein [bacterium]